MKGREVREALQNDVDPRIVHCIASVAEEVSAMGQEIKAVALLLNQLTDVIGGITETMREVRNVVDKKNG